MLLHRKQIAGLVATTLYAAIMSQAESAPADPALKVLDRWHLGGPDAWDYLTLDAAGQRLYVSRGTRVEVVDTCSGKLLGTIANTNGVRGIALAEDLKRGYTSNGKGDSVTVFDLDTLNTIKEASISGQNPDAIVYQPRTKHLFTFNRRSQDISVFDANSLAAIATIPVPGKPEFAVDGGEGRLFANIESEPGQMVVIDGRQMTVTAIWSLPGCANPTGLAIDQAHHRLFSVCDDNIMAVTDAETGKQIAKVKIGEGPDATAFDAKRGLVFSSNGDGSLTIVRQDSVDRYRVVGSLPTMRGARTMALDPTSGKIYLVSAELGAAPAPTPDHPHPRPAPLPGTATVLVVGAP